MEKKKSYYSIRPRCMPRPQWLHGPRPRTQVHGEAFRPAHAAGARPARARHARRMVTVAGRGRGDGLDAATFGSTTATSRSQRQGNGLEVSDIVPLHRNQLKTARKWVLTGGVVRVVAHRQRRGRRMAHGRRQGRR
jgi:hypothetical protein